MGKMNTAPYTGTYRATEEGFHYRHYEEGQTDQFDKGDPLPHYFEFVGTPPTETAPFAPTTTAVVDVEPSDEPTEEEYRVLAKELGIGNYWNKNIDKLKDEIIATQEA